MGTPRAYGATAVLEGTLYALGGMVLNVYNHVVERFDLATGAWQEVAIQGNAVQKAFRCAQSDTELSAVVGHCASLQSDCLGAGAVAV